MSLGKAMAKGSSSSACAISPGELEPEAGVSASFVLFNAVPSYLISFLTHLVLVIVMALITLSQTQETFRQQIVASSAERVDLLENLPIEQTINFEPTISGPTDAIERDSQPIVDSVTAVDIPSSDIDPAPAIIEFADFVERTAPKQDLVKEYGTLEGTGYDRRGQARTGKLDIGREGGTPESEQAVALALAWLANHQNSNGSFNFNHQLAPQCGGKCDHRGSMDDCTTGATGLALLPFLGAGQTHKEGKYRATVEKALYYLQGKMKVQNNMASLAEGGGNLYSHGICAIVLCEAYGMTHDKNLLQPAQAALNYTMYAQDPVGGGWRYTARQPGDTSAVGWQLMALKSGHLAYLQVNPQTVQGAVRFLDTVQSESGAQYGYTSPGGGPATNAIGLLSRMYLGWKKEHPALERGVVMMSATGPSANNMYYNYYATQVMRHYGGKPWEKWNPAMRDGLVAAQSSTGHETGSWYMAGGDHGAEAGGRIYCTAMATMILEVYYRHMPLYSNEAADNDFPL